MPKHKPWQLNSNAIHNVLNISISVISVWGLFDWSSFGITPDTALKVVAALGFIKLTMNAVRDGLKGMVEPQPPVASRK